MQYGYAYQLGERAGGLDPDAKAYILAVEAADGQTLESGVKKAYNTFVKGCKSDGIWDAIKASCIMAGARTLSGALVPLKGTAPTNFNFVSGDYDRETGLKGNASTKYLNSNRNNNAEPQNNCSVSAFVSTAATAGSLIGCGGASNGSTALTGVTGSSRLMCSNAFAQTATGVTEFFGVSRSLSTSYLYRRAGTNQTVSEDSQTPFNGNNFIFGINVPPLAAATDARIAFYHIGESVDLVKLDSRVTTLMSDIATAIP